MLATNSNIGILQVQYIHTSETGEDTFPSYLIEFADEWEREYWVNDFLNRASSFAFALLKKDPLWAPITAVKAGGSVTIAVTELSATHTRLPLLKNDAIRTSRRSSRGYPHTGE